MSDDMNDDGHLDDAPAVETTIRLTVSMESEAAGMLDALARRLYPRRRASQARGLVLEMAVRALYRRMTEADPGNANHTGQA